MSAKDPRTIIRETYNSRIIQRLRRHYPIEIFPSGDGLIVRIQLKDRLGKLVDVFDIPTNHDGFVHIETVIEFVVLAWEVALDDSLWRAGTKRIQKMVWSG